MNCILAIEDDLYHTICVVNYRTIHLIFEGGKEGREWTPKRGKFYAGQMCHLRVLTTLKQRQRLKPAPTSHITAEMPRARQIPPKENTSNFRTKCRIHASTRQNSHFLPGTLYFSSFYLPEDFVKISLLTRFEKNLMTFHYKKSMVSGSDFHF